MEQLRPRRRTPTVVHKQLWSLVSDGFMLQDTAMHGVGSAVAASMVVCNQEHCFLVAEQMRVAGIATPSSCSS